MADNVCRKCGNELLPGAKFCSKCRTAVSAEADVQPAEEMRCRSCGAVMVSGAKFCPKCRTPVAEAIVSPFASFKQEETPQKASKAAKIRNAVLAAVCLALLVLSIIFVPGRIRKARDVEEADEFIVVSDELTPEQEAEYERINAALEAGEYDIEEASEEEHIDYYEEDFGYYEWMNYDDGEPVGSEEEAE